MDKNDVMQILDGCGFYATTGIEVLLDRCLVTINRENKIMMHDLLRDMGRDIVHAENPDFPGERSRLWHPEDVNDVLIDKSGTEKIDGLALNFPRVEETSFSTGAFRNMKRLRLLQLNYVRLAGGYHCLSKNLRWLCWHGFPLEFIPIELCQPNIVAIDMQYSSLKQVLCEYSGLLNKLKILNLSHSHNLTQSPDFSKLPNLEKLILKDCKRLAKVHKSIGDLKSLVLVNLKDCKTLKALPRSFYKSKSVKTLVLDGCSRFRSLSKHLGKMASLLTLFADGTGIKNVPPSIVRLEKLECLSLSYCKCPLQLPSLRGLRSLRDLILTDNNLEEVPNDIGSSLPCLQNLRLDKNNFRSLPSLSGLSMLHALFLIGCRNLVEITDLPKSLGILEMNDCSALERMPDFSGMSTIVYLGCPKLIEFPGLDSAINSGLRLDMLNPPALVPEPWQASGEMLSGIDPEATAVEPTLVPHIQNMPRPRGADAAGLLLRELELRPPAKEWGRRNMYGEPWFGPDDMGPQDDTTKLCNSSDPPDSESLESCGVYYGADALLPRKRGMSERDATFGLNTSVGLGQCSKRQRHRRSSSW